MGSLVESLFGPSSWGMSRQPGDPFSPSIIPKYTGIIVYHALWKDATGHFDLWTGKGFLGTGNFDSLKESAFDIELWKLS